MCLGELLSLGAKQPNFPCTARVFHFHDCFSVSLLEDGTVRWTTPTGHSYDRPRRPVLEAMTYLNSPDLQFGLPWPSSVAACPSVAG